MNAQHILERALLKAHKGGWEPLDSIPWQDVQIEQWQGNGIVGIALLYGTDDTAVRWVRELEGIIFNHEFAKALWGERDMLIIDPDQISHSWLQPWQAHLQQMVIAEDPIKYLGKNLD